LLQRYGRYCRAIQSNADRCVSGVILHDRQNKWLSEQYCIQDGNEIFFIEIPDDLDIGDFLPLPVNKQDSGRTKEIKTLEQLGVIRCAISHVDLYEAYIFQSRLYLGIRKGKTFHFFAGNTPVRIKIDHDIAPS